MRPYIYLDNSASTRLDERVLEAMKPFFFENYAVATSEFAYSLGVEAKEALEGARERISRLLGASPGEFLFTSDPTEANNLAIQGVATALAEQGRMHFITSKIEDFSVLNTFRALEKRGASVTYLAVDERGFVDLDLLRRSLRKDTALISIQHANQEIGTVQDLAKIARLAKEHGLIFHSDCAHTFMRAPLDVSAIPADLLTVSAHTLHGPRGIAGLYVRKGTPIRKILEGGFQENNLRPGMENIPGVMGFARALELITPEENERLREMRDRLIEGLLSSVPDSILNGDRWKRIPQNANITFRFVEGESLTLHLDFRGIAVNTGSACFSKSLEASHVILGIGGDHERAHGSLRYTLSRFNTMEEMETVIQTTAEIVSRLRKISPLGKE